MVASIIILFVLVASLATWCVILKVQADDDYDSLVSLEANQINLNERICKLEAKLRGLEEVATENHYRIEELEKASIGTYKDEFKDECIALVDSGISIREVSRTKEVPYSTLQKWIKLSKKCTQESSNE